MPWPFPRVMDSQWQSITKTRYEPQMSSRRNSASSLMTPQPSRRNSQSNALDQDQRNSDDGYDYNSVDEAPEAEPTKVKVQGEAPAHARDDPPGLPTILKNGDPDVTFEETRPNIYQRRFAGRWAQVPDEEKAIANGATGDHREKESQPRIETNLSTASRDSVKARHIALSWKLVRTDTKLILELNLAAPQTKSKDEVLPKRVLWQHNEQRLLGIHKLEEEIVKCQSRGLSESEVGLTKRLLERVRSTAEKSFVGGKFLVPTALRYDNQDVSRYTVDKTCIFFSFPYFLVAETSYREYAGKGKPEHPPRTLLQSRYRLNQTVERDEKQCIRLLDGKGVASSIAVQAGDDISIPKQGTQHLVYVPQLWGVIIGLDTMVTCGPISESALQSSAVVTTKTNPISAKSKLALVRIQFEYNNEREDLIYPIHQCNSWLGLLNKQQQIIEFLGDEKGKAKPKDYRFWLENTQLTINNWTTLIDKSQSTEMLSIWMKSEVPEIKVSPAGETSGGASTNPTGPNAQKARTITEPNLTFVISPILAWPILDSFGDVDKQPVSTRIDRFLTRIYLFLFMGDGIHKQQRAIRPTLANAQQYAANENFPIAAKSFLELEQYITTECTSQSATKIFKKFHIIFCFFIPEEHDQNLISIQFYWGAVHEICEAAETQYLKPGLAELLKALDSIVYHGIRLHQGVYCKMDAQDGANQAWTRKETLAEGTILLATMVDAFGAIFHMLVEILRFLRQSSKAADVSVMGSDFKVKEYSSDAVKYLKAGWDQLVRELHGRDKSNTIGPVVTPEAITIKLMERLVFGVFQKSQIDIIQLYEECLEHLSLKVESEASRRLLQRINVFQDEVAIINRVLKEQHDVLLSLCKSLDPTTFRSPSIARKLRYNFECASINKVLATLKEQIKNCSELQERAKQLAVQNVQLVETLQDDQSRAIFVFTLVTIIFLPLSFIAGFFGMNFSSITSSTYGVWHFWEIAVPLTFAVLVLCTFIAFKGELVFNWVSRSSRWLTRTLKIVKQKKN